MASTTFASGTVIASTWLNDVNQLTYSIRGHAFYVTDSAYGADPTGAADSSAAFAAATTAAAAVNGTVVIPSGTYKLVSTWAIPSTWNAFRVVALGKVVLSYTGAAQAVTVDAGASSGSLYGGVFGGEQPIKIKGNASCTDALFVRSVHHSLFNVDQKDCTTGIRVNFAVCTTFNTECSVNTDGGFVKTPTNGMVLDIRGAGEYVAACNINPVIEGVSGAAIVGTNVSFSRIQNGTAEGCAKGITLSATCYGNTMENMDLEANTVSDIEDSGNNNVYKSLRSLSAGSGSNIQLKSGCGGASFHGGLLREVNMNASSTGASFFGCGFSSGVGLTGTINSTTVAAVVGCTLFNGSAVVTAKQTDLVGEYGGTFTPALASAGGGAQGATTLAVGTYTKVGKLVYVQGNISIAKGTLGAGAVSITGLPFGSRNTTNDFQFLTCGTWESVTLGAGYTHMVLRIAANGTVATLIKSGTAVVSAVVNVADFPDPMVFTFSGVYEAA